MKFYQLTGRNITEEDKYFIRKALEGVIKEQVSVHQQKQLKEADNEQTRTN